MSGAGPRDLRDAAERASREAARSLGRALRFVPEQAVEQIIHDFAMCQADWLLRVHASPDSRVSLERSLRMLARQGLALPVGEEPSDFEDPALPASDAA